MTRSSGCTNSSGTRPIWSPSASTPTWERTLRLLKKYAETLGYDWHIAVAPLLVARALGNLYSAQYLNPPVSPMLVIDRNGQVLGLPFGLKSAEALQGVVSPLLGP